MFIYFLVSILVNYRSAEAAPILVNRADTPQDLTSSIQLKRTLFGIIWSCISTVVICAWTSVHPNVPPPNQWKARWNRFKIMFWMVIAPELVLAWAVRQFFGARQIRDEYNRSRPGKSSNICTTLLVETSDADLAKRKKWTLAHGHMVEMGGFVFADPEDEEDPGEGGKVVTFDDLKRLLQDPKFKFPAITDADIQDRSKGDALWKIIAILQTTWFIIQCIARHQQRLALTELELVTLALASLNAVTFGIWWHKPLGVQEPVRIYRRTEARKADDGARQVGRSFDLSFGGVFSKSWGHVKIAVPAIPSSLLLALDCDGGPIRALFYFISFPVVLVYVISFPVFVLFPLGVVLLLRIIETKQVPQETSPSRGLLAVRIVASLQTFRYRLSSTVSEFVRNKLEAILADGYDDGVFGFLSTFLFGWFFLLPSLFLLLLLFLLFLIPFFTLLFLGSFIFIAFFGIVTTSTVPSGASYVPSFYAPTTTSDRWSRMVVSAFFGVVFGGLHCIGWNFEYPTHSEQTLWRATSLAITVIPLVVAPIDFLLANRDVTSCGMIERIALLIMDPMMSILLFIYVPARLFLIAQALALLREQPPSALVAVDWTKYIPHLFS